MGSVIEITWLLACVAACTSHFSAGGWLFNLMSHFQIQHAVILAVFCCWFLLRAKPIHSILSCICVALSVLEMAPYLVCGDRPFLRKSGTACTRFMQMNLFVANHDYPKLGAADRQIQQLRFVARKLASIDGAVIVVGDLNTTPWAKPYQELLANCHLKDPRIGRGLLPSWPCFSFPFSIPIDHVLVSQNLKVLSLLLGPFVGSDHRPLVLDIQN